MVQGVGSNTLSDLRYELPREFPLLEQAILVKCELLIKKIKKSILILKCLKVASGVLVLLSALCCSAVVTFMSLRILQSTHPFCCFIYKKSLSSLFSSYITCSGMGSIQQIIKTVFKFLFLSAYDAVSVFVFFQSAQVLYNFLMQFNRPCVDMGAFFQSTKHTPITSKAVSCKFNLIWRML